MKAWGWLAAGLIWLAAIIAATFDFEAHAFGGFGVGVRTSSWLPPRVAIVLAGLLMHLLLFGWTVPLAIGVKRLISNL
jgi:hypothetical protein